MPLDDKRRGTAGLIVLHVADDPGETTVLRRDLEAVTLRQPVTPHPVRGRKPSLAGTGHRFGIPGARDRQTRVAIILKGGVHLAEGTPFLRAGCRRSSGDAQTPW
jgi:hypothetical protein